MKLAIASDIHLEFGPLVLTNDEAADVLILAGDICVARDLEMADKNLYAENKRAARYLEFFNDVAAKFPKVIYIMGNHEHYDGDFAYTYDILKRALAHLSNLHLLEKETLNVDDITFIGATVWTDMNGGDPITLMHIKDMMNEFRGVKNDNQKVTQGAFV
jgi:Icc-related predicted phosphoesterase